MDDVRSKAVVSSNARHTVTVVAFTLLMLIAVPAAFAQDSLFWGSSVQTIGISVQTSGGLGRIAHQTESGLEGSTSVYLTTYRLALGTIALDIVTKGYFANGIDREEDFGSVITRINERSYLDVPIELSDYYERYPAPSLLYSLPLVTPLWYPTVLAVTPHNFTLRGGIGPSFAVNELRYGSWDSFVYRRFLRFSGVMLSAQLSGDFRPTRPFPGFGFFLEARWNFDLSGTTGVYAVQEDSSLLQVSRIPRVFVLSAGVSANFGENLRPSLFGVSESPSLFGR